QRRSIPMAGTLVRPHNRMIAGVCSGLARRFGMSPGTVRLLFVISCLLPGPQFVIYIVLWVMMPSED
ncbi:MAG TPA: PspC domain-containing protein, partial [Nocardioidaceae bacterium]|nr:PspC domain-containing protein [Nocardioidaceae bacterium]